MKSARLRRSAVGLLAVAFLGWVSWLGYLALPSTTPRDVLSRPQFLVSTLDVIARVNADAEGKPLPSVEVEEVLWPTGPNKVWRKLPVLHLDRCEGWNGPGLYILPLVEAGDQYQVAVIPRSPGYEGLMRAPRIYPATPVNRAQLASLPPKPN